MRSRALPALVGATALTLATALVGTANAHDSALTTTSGIGITAPASEHQSLAGKKCKGADYTGPVSGSVTAQDFEASSDVFDAVGGQAFELSKKCKVKSVYVDGSGNPDAGTLHVWIYKTDSNGVPDESKEVCHSGITGYAGPVFDVPFSCKLKKNVPYAIAVQNEVNREPNGQWFWNIRTGTDVASWKNPENGFGTGCTSFGRLSDCLGLAGYEFIFALQKGPAR